MPRWGTFKSLDSVRSSGLSAWVLWFAIALPASSTVFGQSGLLRNKVVEVPRGESRSFIFTNKETAFFYGETGRLSQSALQGFNVMTYEFLEDYVIQVDGRSLERGNAAVELYPDHLVRQYADSGIREEVSLLDSLNVLVIDLRAPGPREFKLLPGISGPKQPESFETEWDARQGIFFVSQRSRLQEADHSEYPKWMGITQLPGGVYSSALQANGSLSSTFATSVFVPGALTVSGTDTVRYFLIVGFSPEDIAKLASTAESRWQDLVEQRLQRFNRFQEEGSINSNRRKFGLTPPRSPRSGGQIRNETETGRSRRDGSP